jgi:uncharacterized protein with PIN domain
MSDRLVPFTYAEINRLAYAVTHDERDQDVSLVEELLSELHLRTRQRCPDCQRTLEEANP